MRSGRVLATLVAALGGLGASGSSAQDTGNIQGAWAVVSAERNGKPAPDVAGHRLTFSGDAFTIRHERHTLYRGTYAVDPDRKPAEIDFQHADGELKGKVWKGIYRFEGAALRICDNAPDMARPRPTLFSAKAGSGHICVVFRRATG
jgi:uncharacterized protein (TIGR03067 family)